jgi:hypothetical protein
MWRRAWVHSSVWSARTAATSRMIATWFGKIPHDVGAPADLVPINLRS